jgi:hypothetical protein
MDEGSGSCLCPKVKGRQDEFCRAVYMSRTLRNFPVPRATCLNLEKQELGVIGVPGVDLTTDLVLALSKLEPCNLRYLYFQVLAALYP